MKYIAFLLVIGVMAGAVLVMIESDRFHDVPDGRPSEHTLDRVAGGGEPLDRPTAVRAENDAAEGQPLRVHEGQPLPVYARKYAITDDLADLNDRIFYDAAISFSDVSQVFMTAGGPELRALIVSGEFVDRISPKPAGGGSPEYKAVMNVWRNNHAVFAIDRTSEDVMTRLEFIGGAAPFDSRGRIVPATSSDTSKWLAATGLWFAPNAGWSEYRVSAPAVTSRPGAPVGPLSRPPYESVDSMIERMFRDSGGPYF